MLHDLPDCIRGIVDLGKLGLGRGRKHGVVCTGIGGMAPVAGEIGAVLAR